MFVIRVPAFAGKKRHVHQRGGYFPPANAFTSRYRNSLLS